LRQLADSCSNCCDQLAAKQKPEDEDDRAGTGWLKILTCGWSLSAPGSFLVVAVVLTLVSNLSAADWPQWRGLNRDGHSAETINTDIWNPAPPVAWYAEVGIGFSSMAIADGRVYTLGNKDDTDTIFALDETTGKLVWKHSYPAPLDPNLFEGGPTATPTIVDGQLFSFSRRGELIALNAKDGTVQWTVNLKEKTEANIPAWGFASSPLRWGELVIVNSGSAGTALNAKTGEIVWHSDNSDDAGYTSPFLMGKGDKAVVAIASAKAVSGVKPATGELVWSHRWITRYGVNAADPIPVGDKLFISSGYAKGSALLNLSGAEPDEVWRARDLRNQMSPGVLVDGHIYALDGDAGSDTKFLCIEAATGTVKWSQDGLSSATVIAAGKHLVILSGKGELLIVPAIPEEFEPISRMEVIDGKCWTIPAIANGNLYVRNATGTLKCLKVSK